MELFQVHEKIEGFERIDFEKKDVRKGMRAIGAIIRKDSREKIAINALKRTRGRKVYTGSTAGEYPRKLSGTTRKSITAKISRPGFLVKIWPDPKYFSKGDYYPAFLFYGVTGKAKRQDHKAQTKTGKFRIAPRGNYITDTLKEREGDVRKILSDTLYNALKVCP